MIEEPEKRTERPSPTKRGDIVGKVPSPALRRRGERRLHAVRARWLMDFANADLAPMTDEDAERLGERLLEWIDTAPTVSSWRRITDTPFANPYLPIGSDVATIRSTQQDLRTCISRLMTDGYVEVPHAGAHLVLVRDGAGEIQRRVYGGSAFAQFFAMVAEILADLGPALRRCARDPCTNFVAALGHTRYCSTACTRRAITQRYNETHRAEIIARKRRARAEKRTPQHGDAVPGRRRVRRPGSRRREPTPGRG